MIFSWLCTYAEAYEGRNRYACRLENLTNALLIVFCEVLLKKNVLFEVTGNAAFNDLGESSLWLAFVASGFFGNATLGLNGFGRHVFTTKYAR